MAEDASKEAISTREALHVQLTQALAAENASRSKCHHLEMQATSAASQLQEMQQQVDSSTRHHIHCPVHMCCMHMQESLRTCCISAAVIWQARGLAPGLRNGRVLQGGRCDAQVSRADELHQQATKYCGQLQEFNGRLQSDSQAATERVKTLQASNRPPANSLYARADSPDAQWVVLSSGTQPAADSSVRYQSAEVMLWLTL